VSTISTTGIVTKHGSLHWSLGGVPTWLDAVATIGEPQLEIGRPAKITVDHRRSG
jgi:hypothetical protein